MKKLLLCICSAALLLGCMCACAEDEEHDYSNDWYLVEECSEGTISGSSAEPWFDDEIVVCNSVAQLKSYVNSDFD